MTKTLKEIAELLGGKLQGDGNVKISGVNNIEGAAEGDMTFADEKHLEEAMQCKASAVLLSAKTDGSEFPMPVIYVENTRATFAILLNLFVPAIQHEKGVSSEELCKIIAQAQEARRDGTQVLVARMNKNKKLQKEQLEKEGYTQFQEFYKEPLKQ